MKRYKLGTLLRCTSISGRTEMLIVLSYSIVEYLEHGNVEYISYYLNTHYSNYIICEPIILFYSDILEVLHEI